MDNQQMYFRSHMFSLRKAELAMHENLITCIIFSNKEQVKVSGKENEVSAKIICIKPDLLHRVSIPDDGAEILYLDGVKLPNDAADFEVLSNDWADIPRAFYKAEHKTMDKFRDFLDNTSSSQQTTLNNPILSVIEQLYTYPLKRMSQDELAQQLGLERTQALKYFKSVTGQTFRRFKKWAASVTVTSSVFNGVIIAHAGLDAGFSDPSHTSRTAKEVFGLTPTDGVTSLAGISTLQKKMIAP